MKDSVMKKLPWIFLFISSLLLASCNSGGGGSGGGTSNFSIGGSITGLNSSKSVVLADNGGNLTTVSENGNFTFSQTIAKNSNYKVTVVTQPIGETCTVVNSSGYNIVNNVTDIQVICATQTFTIGGKVENLNPGAAVTLYSQTNNSYITLTGENTTSPISFTFNAPVSYGSGYSVIVTSQPIGEICAVTNYKNTTPVTSNIANILVTCSDKNYTISGNIYGLLPNEQVTLLNNDANPIKKIGSFINPIPFTFTNVPSGSSYKITIPKSMQPANEKCVVSGNSGQAINSDISGVIVTCSKDLYSITTNVSGIALSDSVTLENNGSNESSITNNTGSSLISHIFTDIPYQSNYDITATANGYSCTSINGKNISANINVDINCTQEYFLMYAFQGATTDGKAPLSGLVIGQDGYLYGTTNKGGAYGNGSIYKVDPATNIEMMVYSFQGGSDGANPSGNLLVAHDGTIYGTTEFGGNPQNGAYNSGTIFKFDPHNNHESIIYTLNGGTDGSKPQSGLIEMSDGYLYGTASENGISPFGGTVFKIQPTGDNFSVIYSFKNTNDGYNPVSNLVKGSDGYLYGTTKFGSSNNPVGGFGYGTIFKISPTTKIETIIHSFNGSTDGAYPENALIEYSPGVFYGAVPYNKSTSEGIGSGNGLVYKYTSSNGYQVIYAFKNGGDGINPNGQLLKGQNGNLYGVTWDGGVSGYGTIYQINPTTNQEQVMYSFLGYFSTDGENPIGMLLSQNGYLYGTTYQGGMNNFGSVFKFKQ